MTLYFLITLSIFSFINDSYYDKLDSTILKLENADSLAKDIIFKLHDPNYDLVSLEKDINALSNSVFDLDKDCLIINQLEKELNCEYTIEFIISVEQHLDIVKKNCKLIETYLKGKVDYGDGVIWEKLVYIRRSLGSSISIFQDKRGKYRKRCSE